MIKKTIVTQGYFLTVENKRNILTKETETTIYYTENSNLQKEFSKKIVENYEILQYIQELAEEFTKQIEEIKEERVIMKFKEDELEEMLIIGQEKRIEFLKELILSLYKYSKRHLTIDITEDLNLSIRLKETPILRLDNNRLLLK